MPAEKVTVAGYFPLGRAVHILLLNANRHSLVIFTRLAPHNVGECCNSQHAQWAITSYSSTISILCRCDIIKVAVMSSVGSYQLHWV